MTRKPRKGDRVRVVHCRARDQDCRWNGREGVVASAFNLSEVGVELDGWTFWFERDELVIL